LHNPEKGMKALRLSEVAKLLGGELIGTDDPMITGVSGIEEAGPGDLTFLARKNFSSALAASGAAAVLVGPDIEVDIPSVRVGNPYAAFADFLEGLLPDPDRVFPPGVHPTAVIDATADVTSVVSVGPYCVIGPGTVVGTGTRLGAHVVLGCDVSIGADCRIYAGVTMREGCLVGDRVWIHSGAVLGSDGFGYLPGPAGIRKIPQVGIVEIQDDVEIGAGVCIDRATTGRTVVGVGSKIDNLVQIGHNVRLGNGCSLSAQTGIAGSSTLGDGVLAGGQVGIGDHIHIGAGAVIGGNSGVTNDVPAGKSLFGYPAVDAKESFRMFAALRKLPELLKRVRRLEETGSSGTSGQVDADME
jgi:UDP-3-O-[3-hydroxymyristoyl] glucosamine N-acyltransferase